MISLILTFITSLNTDPAPLGQIEILGLEVEAIYVPAGWSGPVVAVPFDEVIF